MMHSPPRGMVLLLALMINAVISLLILGNGQHLILANKVLNHQKKQQQHSFKQQYVLYELINTITDNMDFRCIQQQDAQYEVKTSTLKWCRRQNTSNYYYRAFDLGVTCCFSARNNTGSHLYLVQVLSKSQSNSVVQAMVAKPQTAEQCSCKKTYKIQNSILNMSQFRLRKNN